LCPAVQARLGAEASEGLVDMFAAYQQFSTDRFERRLTQEVSGLRVEIVQLRVDIERMRSDVIKWNLVFSIGQFAAMLGALQYMLGAR
jgi:hypothetical protein